ncbi:hypothetical protein BCR42DRAFT_427357 [Absidia repens]|uniref:Uncharacterized protein n=1 Tax=Absidia repens TaxID=90262 RepID=A0A1X2I061_9FUNG|nr:hypothetical protein BCR42DRAFT_427357 [Absidia repens]
MVQASSFLFLLAFSAVMIQGAPLAARSKEHHTKDKPPTEESKLQRQDDAPGSPQTFGQQASGFGPTLPFVQQGPAGPPLGTGGTRSASSGPPATPPSRMDPQNPQTTAELPAAQQGPVQEHRKDIWDDNFDNSAFDNKIPTLPCLPPGPNNY